MLPLFQTIIETRVQTQAVIQKTRNYQWSLFPFVDIFICLKKIPLKRVFFFLASFRKTDFSQSHVARTLRTWFSAAVERVSS